MEKKEKTGTIFEGTIHGTVTSTPLFGVGKGPVVISFSVKIDEEIEGIPNEIGVYFYHLAKISLDPKLFQIILRANDRVTIKGKIKKERLSEFPNYSIIMTAEYIYNETLKCGYT
nr:hypothetical protein [Candidatus Freyarchaeota archaeon]